MGKWTEDVTHDRCLTSRESTAGEVVDGSSSSRVDVRYDRKEWDWKKRCLG